jgi:hypothetical protein
MQNPRHKTGNFWAMWWGITIGLLFLTAATIGFNLDDLDTGASSSRSYATR